MGFRLNPLQDPSSVLHNGEKIIGDGAKGFEDAIKAANAAARQAEHEVLSQRLNDTGGLPQGRKGVQGEPGLGHPDGLLDSLLPFLPFPMLGILRGVKITEFLAMKAGEFLPRFVKGSVKAQFPGEMLDKTIGEIRALAKKGVKAAQTAWKLLSRAEYRK